MILLIVFAEKIIVFIVSQTWYLRLISRTALCYKAISYEATVIHFTWTSSYIVKDIQNVMIY